MRPLALLLLVAAAASAQDDPRRPPLYAVEAGVSKVYLLGSVHLLPEGGVPLPVHVETAFATASVVAFEVDPRETAASPVDLLAAATDEATIGDLLDGAQQDSLAAALRRVGRPAGALDAVEPWYGALRLGGYRLRGVPTRPGVDRYLFQKALQTGKETLALETLADQVAALDGVSDTAQVGYLLGLAAVTDGAAAFEAFVGAWASGDEARLWAAVADEMGHGEMHEALLAARNRRWLPTVLDLLARPGEVSMVVVGAGHLVGPDSLVELLRAAGHKVRKL